MDILLHALSGTLDFVSFLVFKLSNTKCVTINQFYSGLTKNHVSYIYDIRIVTMNQISSELTKQIPCPVLKY
jgi:hypothetical protein